MCALAFSADVLFKSFGAKIVSSSGVVIRYQSFVIAQISL